MRTPTRVSGTWRCRVRRQGVAVTSIRDVAAAAGLSPGLVQHHFGPRPGCARRSRPT
ncbi:helix-turn-helix domain-containing protein [Actinomadura fibrosa]|uniref:Helix-turn-helix domain-containing protein n=1 Tax=Actinomadura fibrosa TaxID=111802 RepID=A0ABW2Y4I6_9ACTN